MKFSKFYTINELDYNTLESYVSNSNLPKEALNMIKIMMADHRAMVEAKKTIIEEQSKTSEGLFGPIDYSCKPLVKNEENTPNNTTEIIDQPFSKEEEKDEKKPKKGKKKLPTGKTIYNSISEDQKKCPSCGSKMFMERAKKRTYVLALPLLSTETHITESCRCLCCNTRNLAKSDSNIQDQSIGRYHYSAISSIIALRYQYGMASYRLEQMSDIVGIRISDSTQWYLFEEAATVVRPFVAFLEKKVANAPVQHIDDTHNTIINLVREIREEQEIAISNGKDPKSVRSGIHTTNITAKLEQGNIVLYRTGLHHAGEILSKILSKRTIEEQVIIMADASNVSLSKLNDKRKENVNMANCNSHAVRKFKELSESEKEILKKANIDREVSEPITFFLKRYKIIFNNEQLTKNMSQKDRLIFHAKHSLPLMHEMHIRADNDIKNKKLEPTSEIGKTYQYFVNHFQKLAAFCFLEGAPVCNNLCERFLKCIIRHRKNSLFFKSQLGAYVGDIFTTILFTAKINNINSIEYLKHLLIYKSHWEKNFEAWLPWNYERTLAQLTNSTTLQNI